MSLSATPLAAAGPTCRILVIIEALPAARPVLAHLAEVGLECHYAPGGAVGLAAFRELPPHLVVLDAAISDMPSEQVCKTIRERSHVPIIVLTDTPASGARAAATSANEYLARNITPETLVERVEALLQCVYGGIEAGQASRHLAEATPAGWASCEACDYMGPRARFETIRFGEPHLVCPNCKRDDALVQSIG